MLARVATRGASVVARTLPASGVAASAARRSLATVQPRVEQQSSSSSSRSSSWSRRLLAGAIAVVSGGLAFAACETVVEQAPFGGVDYTALRKDLEELIESAEGYDDGSYGPLLVRLAWHSAGTYDRHKKKFGSDGATMRFSPESNHGANAGLQIARDLLEPIKKKYPNCTYADLYTLAGTVAIQAMGGPEIGWNAGRSDAKDESSCPPDGSLPDASKGQDHVRDIFYRMGFNDREIVALCGAHALGRCHTDRSGYKGPWTRAPTTFSNEYYRLLVEEEWTPKKWNGPLQYENSKSGADLMMLPADLALIKDPKFRKYVEYYAADEQAFFADFARAFQKLMELGVDFNKKTQINLKKQ